MDGPSISLDPIEVAKFLASLLLSPKLASIVGPYSIIIMAAVLGAATALGVNKQPRERWSSFWFILRGVLSGLILTVPVSTLIASYKASWEAQWLFIPVAAGMAYLGDKWNQLFPFALNLAKSWLRLWVNGSNNKREEE